MDEYTPVVAGDHHGTSPRLLALLDLVDLVEALALVRLLQLLGERIIADGAGVHHGPCGEHVLDE